MSPDAAPSDSVRSAAELNAAIRALWSHPAVPLTRKQRERYALLLAELRQAERWEITAAA